MSNDPRFSVLQRALCAWEELVHLWRLIRQQAGLALRDHTYATFASSWRSLSRSPSVSPEKILPDWCWTGERGLAFHLAFEKQKTTIPGQYLQSDFWTASKEKRKYSFNFFFSWKHSIIHEPCSAVLREASPPECQGLAFLCLLTVLCSDSDFRVTVGWAESSFLGTVLGPPPEVESSLMGRSFQHLGTQMMEVCLPRRWQGFWRDRSEL